jgi:hypothetical protein
MNQVNRDIFLEKEITWKIKNNLTYNPETENFLDYIKREKDTFDKSRPLKELAPITIVVLGLCFVMIYTILMLIDFSITFFLNGEFLGPPDLQSKFFSLLVLTSVLSSVLGQILVIFTLSFKYFLTNDNWSKFHNQTLSLAERLSGMNILDKYIRYNRDESDQQSFQLIKLSLDFQVQWIFPFIFNAFPPLLIEIMFIALLLPFSIATIFSLIIAFLEANWIITIGMTILMVIILIGLYSNVIAVLRSWFIYSWIRETMITHQQGVLHELTLKNEEPSEILRNENNLTRLEAMHPFPLPSLFRFTAFIPLVGSLLGYLIGFMLLF